MYMRMCVKHILLQNNRLEVAQKQPIVSICMIRVRFVDSLAGSRFCEHNAKDTANHQRNAKVQNRKEKENGSDRSYMRARE